MQIRVKILKVLRETAVPGKVLMMTLTLDCSMIKATIGAVNSAKCDTLHYRPHLTKITTILSGFSTGYFHVKIFSLGRSVSLIFFVMRMPNWHLNTGVPHISRSRAIMPTNFRLPFSCDT